MWVNKLGNSGGQKITTETTTPVCKGDSRIQNDDWRYGSTLLPVFRFLTCRTILFDDVKQPRSKLRKMRYGKLERFVQPKV